MKVRNTIAAGLGLIGVVLGTYGLVKHFGNGEEGPVRASITWDDGVAGQTFTDGSAHQAHLLIENLTTEEITLAVFLGSDAWASEGPFVAPYWFIVWDPLPSPHYPIVIGPCGSMLWDHEITMRSTYGQDYGLKEVVISVQLEPNLEEVLREVIDTINLVAT